MNKYAYTLLLTTLLLTGAGALRAESVAQSDSLAVTKPKKGKLLNQPVATKPLFATDEVLSLTLTARMQPILRDRAPLKDGEAGTPHPALLTVAGEAGVVQLPVQLRARGNFRKSSGNCAMPPLFVDVPKKKAQNTVFAGQSSLKLVTHCADEAYVVREYLAYRIANLLTDLSYRARLAQVTYADSAKKGSGLDRSGLVRWGVLLEDIGDVAKRNRATTFKNRYKAEHCDTLAMATVALFEYLIGNTDWSVAYRHNIRMLTDSAHRRPVPVPYDFDHAGIVSAPYARPAEALGIESVRQRLYRGPIYPLSVLNRVIEKFNAVKPQLYALYEGNPQLDRSYIRQTVAYLDEFYTLINTPKQMRKVFQDPAGRGVQIKGLNN